MKNLLFTVIALLLSLSVSAQFIIPKAGVTLSTLSYEQYDLDQYSSLDYTPVVGFSFGVAYALTLTESISLQPEVLFIKKGYKYTSIYDDQTYYYSNTESKYSLSYLEFPILARFSFGKEGLKFHVVAGPSIAFGLGGKFESVSTFGFSGDLQTTPSNRDIKFKNVGQGYDGPEEIIQNPIDTSLQIGGGVTIGGKVMIDLRYGLGLSDINLAEKSKNNVLQLSVGVPLQLK